MRRDESCSSLIMPTETPADSPVPSGATTPKKAEAEPKTKPRNGDRTQSPKVNKKAVVTCDSDIEPDDLIPVYLDVKSRLLEAERGSQGSKTRRVADPGPAAEEERIAKLHAKLDRIEKDVLFDRLDAEQRWKTKKLTLEKTIAASKKQSAREAVAETEAEQAVSADTKEADGDINDEAQRMASEILAQGEEEDDEALAGLFADLPTDEVDEATGKTRTVVNGVDGVKIVIRDFGKWSGVSPVRILEEACRARSVSCSKSYLNRHI